jgi:thioredoxin-related protein
MKKLLFIALLFVSAGAFAQEKINWVTLDEAIELQQKEPKKIMMDFYTVWCGPCKMLDRNTFKNKDVAAYVNKYFYAVKFNAEGNSKVKFNGNTFTNPRFDPAKASRRNYPHQLTQYFQVNAYPTIVFLDEEDNLITQVKGYQKPQQLELYLKLFVSNEYKNMKSQEDFKAYYESFVPEFQ